MTSSLSPFRYAEFPRPSIFLSDPAFYRAASTGRRVNDIQSAAVARYEKATGRSCGSIPGISAKGNLLIEEGNHRRAA